MDRLQFWQVAFISIASIRLHPRNVESVDDEERAGKELAFAAHCADVMMRLLEETQRWRRG